MSNNLQANNFSFRKSFLQRASFYENDIELVKRDKKSLDALQKALNNLHMYTSGPKLDEISFGESSTDEDASVMEEKPIKILVNVKEDDEEEDEDEDEHDSEQEQNQNNGKNRVERQNQMHNVPTLEKVPGVVLRQNKKSIHLNGLQLQPTSFYGTLKFDSKKDPKPVPYIRVANNDRPSHAVSFAHSMLEAEHAHVDPPSLILSVTGGALDFDLSPYLYSAISIGLRLASEKTKAWIVSGGTRCGVMKLIGQIMGKNSSSSEDFSPPVIGIATYGIVAQRYNLTKHTEESYIYKVGKTEKAKEEETDKVRIELDDNHTMFFLVDDGSDNAFGKEITWRGKFEAKVGERYDAPVVTIVVQGGPGTVDTAFSAVKNNTPVVSVEGSGGAADIIAYAYNLFHSGSIAHSLYTIEKLFDLISKMFVIKPDFDEVKVKGIMKKRKDYFLIVQEMVKDPTSIVIFDINEAGVEGFSASILQAVFQTKCDTPKAWINKLKQTMHFDDLVLAKEGIDTVAKLFSTNKNELHEIFIPCFIAALQHNKPEFVQMYLDAGVKLNHLHLDSDDVKNKSNALSRQSTVSDLDTPINHIESNFEGVLLDLYSFVAKYSHSHMHSFFGANIRSKNGSSMDDVDSMHTFIQRLIHDSFMITVENDTGGFLDVDIKFPFKMFGADKKTTDEKQDELDKHAAWTLFLWAVLCNRFELATIFWKLGDNSILNALLAVRILTALSNDPRMKNSRLGDARRDMIENARSFEALAVGVLDECYDQNAKTTALILTRPSTLLKSTSTILQLAFDTECLEFHSHRAAVSVKESSWYGSLSGENFVPMFSMLPFLILFRPEQEKYEPREINHFGSKKVDNTNDALPPSPSLERVASVWLAPVTRFVWEVCSHIGLCLLFSVFLLTPLENSLSVMEVVLIAWFLGLFGEEMRQWLELGWDYFKDQWNLLDMINITLYIAGLAMRCSNLGKKSVQYDAKAIFAFNAILLWIRSTRYYAANRLLGPKIIMLKRMLRVDMYIFLMLLMVVLFGYGVAADSLLYPDRPFSIATIKAVFYIPYFQMYGEMNLDTLEAASGCSTQITDGVPYENCDSSNGFLVPFLLSIYTLLSAILLVNLLIAMFTTTYEEIQEKAEKLYHLQQYDIYLEYKERSPLPGPLVLFHHMYLIISWVKEKCTRRHTSDVFGNRDFFDDKTERKLQAFQELNTDKFMLNKQKMSHEDIEFRLKQSSTMLSRALHIVGDVKEISTSFRTSVERQFTSLADIQSSTSHAQTLVNDHVGQIKDTLLLALRKIGEMDMVPASFREGMDANEKKLKVESSDSFVTAIDATQGLFLARGFKYEKPPKFVPKKNYYKEAPRVDVPQEMVMWSAKFEGYNPRDFSMSTVMGDGGLDASAITTFNSFDKIVKIDRRTCNPNGFFDLDNVSGRPINPWGRTGLCGRGHFNWWGPNWLVCLIVTRYKRDETGAIIERGGRRALEVLVTKTQEGRFPSLLMSHAKEGEDVLRETSGRTLVEKAMGSRESREFSSEGKSDIMGVLRSASLVGKVYMNDDRNTDNSWAEACVVSFHDDTGDLSDVFHCEQVEWILMHSQANLPPFHLTLCEKVANKKLCLF
eukprot:m.70395 g.70395  ORF g.70395 m.70395 type:complete len:1603 (-) comp8308_c0_seq3:3281-8089(-)